MMGGEIINGFEKQRRKAGFTQVQVAEALGVDQCTVSFWENGNSYPRAKLLPEIAKLFNCKIEDLYEEG